jgi:2-polyprenyl-3-methyl-5-hydroxy-6-metoxy-1,4-benzoquinol methylase
VETEIMSESWDDYADGLDNNKTVVAYALKAYESLLDIVEIEDWKVLDFGCGTGLLTEKISHQASSVVAIDSSEKMISIFVNKRLRNVYTIQGELSQNLININKTLRCNFDLIVASSVLAFVPNYEETLKLLKQLLNKGCLFIQWDWLKEDEASGSGFTKESVESALGQEGFSEHSTSVPFSMEDSEDSLSVVMGVAKNA